MPPDTTGWRTPSPRRLSGPSSIASGNTSCIGSGREMPDLLIRAQGGDRRALNELFRRELPLLRRWAQTRVPRGLWYRADVDDLVQLTFLRTLRRYCDFKQREGAAFQHYLRRILLNLTKDEIRSVVRHPEHASLDGVEAIVKPSALDLLLGRESRARFRAAVAQLRPRSRTALLGRLEQGLTYDEIAELIGVAGPGAARAIVGRSVERVAQLMRQHSRSRRRR